MAGIDLTNEEEVQPLSDGAIARIHDFKEMVLGNGTVSKSDVLSLEEFVGQTLITKTYLTNRFTDVRTSIGVTEAIEAVDTAIKDIKIESKVDIEDIVMVINITLNNISGIRRTINLIRSTEVDVIDRLTNSKYVNKWNEEGDAVIDITDNSVIDVLSFELGYLGNATGRDRDDLNCALEQFNDNKDRNDFQPLTLLSLLINSNVWGIDNIGELTIKEVTFKDVINIMSNGSKSIETLDNLYNSVNSYKQEVIDMYDDEADYITKRYKKLKHLYEVLDDNYSKVILRTIIDLSRA